MEITKREIVVSISIVAIMMIFGVLLYGDVSEMIMDSNERYNKAIRIDSEELFRYGMSTNVGDAFIYGDLVILDPVTFPEVGGEYSYIEKITEEYTEHTREVTYTDSEGETYTEIEIYHTWDTIRRENIKSQDVTFLGVEFSFSRFDVLVTNYIDTKYVNSDLRNKYYGSPIKATGTIFTSLNNNDIGNDITLFEDRDIEETYNYLTSEIGSLILFWIIWIGIIIGCVYAFYQSDNNWLNN